MSRPRVAGVAGGVGTSTVAAAVGAEDLGVHAAGPDTSPVEVVVCRSTVDSVERAHRVVAAVSSRPVLVVVADAPGRWPRAVRALVAMVHPHTAAVVEVPFVATWRVQRHPLARAAAALADHGDRDLVPFARAMQRLADSLAGSLGEHRAVAARVVPDSVLGASTRREDDVDGRDPEARRRELERPVHGRSDAVSWPDGRRLDDPDEGFRRSGQAGPADPWGSVPRGPTRDVGRGDPAWPDWVGPDPSAWSRAQAVRGRPGEPGARPPRGIEFGPGASRRPARPAYGPPGRGVHAPPPGARPSWPGAPPSGRAVPAADDADETQVIDRNRAYPHDSRRSS